LRFWKLSFPDFLFLLNKKYRSKIKMDPFTEKDLIENMKSIALSLRNIDRKMDDLTTAIREMGAEMAFDEDAEEILDDSAKEI
jgi:hypothetical protein